MQALQTQRFGALLRYGESDPRFAGELLQARQQGYRDSLRSCQQGAGLARISDMQFAAINRTTATQLIDGAFDGYELTVSVNVLVHDCNLSWVWLARRLSA